LVTRNSLVVAQRYASTALPATLSSRIVSTAPPTDSATATLTDTIPLESAHELLTNAATLADFQVHGLCSTWLPMGWIQNGFFAMHTHLHMPWWSTIALTALSLPLLTHIVFKTRQKHALRHNIVFRNQDTVREQNTLWQQLKRMHKLDPVLIHKYQLSVKKVEGLEKTKAGSKAGITELVPLGMGLLATRGFFSSGVAGAGFDTGALWWSNLGAVDASFLGVMPLMYFNYRVYQVRLDVLISCGSIRRCCR
jgi:hypothetical protein